MFVDKIFISRLAPMLDKFTQKRDNLWNCRCPICGDSKKKSYKTRGFIYVRKNKYNYMCHNCGASMSLANFIKTVSTDLYDEYVVEKWKEGQVGSRDSIPKEVAQPFKFEKPEFKNTCEFDFGDKISDLDDNHPAKKYCLDRKIPNLDVLYYTDNFKYIINGITDEYDNLIEEERIIIPFFDEKCDLIALQGRALGKSDLRYITIKIDHDKPKIYGLDRVVTDKTLYVVEGPLDSLFLENSVAMAGADVDLAYFDAFDDVVFVFDNEPRKPEIINRINSIIEKNYKVVVWPDSLKEKDINDMILSGIDTFELRKIISKNTVSGLKAKLRLTNWKKV
jgi:transcription elongation factor Elf1